MTEPVDPMVARLTGLARQVERLAQRVTRAEATEARIADLARDVTETQSILAGLATELQQRAAAAPAPPAGRRDAAPVWLGLAGADPVEVELWLTGLTGWVRDVYLRFTRVLPACWLWHPDLVTALGWLADAWTEATTGPAASPVRCLDWEARYLPAVARRAAEYASCGPDRHTTTGDAHHPHPATAPLADATPVISAWWATDPDGPGPVPTPEQVADTADYGRRTR